MKVYFIQDRELGDAIRERGKETSLGLLGFAVLILQKHHEQTLANIVYTVLPHKTVAWLRPG